MKLERNCTNIYCMLATDFRPAHYSWEEGMALVLLSKV